MRKIAMLAVLALVAVPAGFADSGSGQTNQPNALCKQQQTAIGAKTFKLLYGANAYGRCVSKMASTLNADKTNAAKQCAAERADAAFPSTHGGKSFAEFYGAGKRDSNAFGKCVSSKARTLDQQQQQATINAAKTCKAERTKLGPTEFTKNYGGHSNAFAKCVSKTAHANP
jgi:hypothetical protein